MPTSMRIGPYRFYFYSYDCGEPRHMHVDKDVMSAKFWLDPDVSLATNYGFSRKELRDIERMTALKKPQISQMTQIFLSSNFASLRLCVSFFRQSQRITRDNLQELRHA
jgi:hypothetical protein